MRTGIEEWFTARLPERWNVSGLEVLADQDEILVLIDLPEAGGSEQPVIREFRESTRDDRMAIARDAEEALGRKVSWGARCGNTAVVFTTSSVPVMTRLRMPERVVLDTLIDARVARSRSEALAWCVKLVGDNESEWIGELRKAFEVVEEARAKGRSRGGTTVPRADRPRRIV